MDQKKPRRVVRRRKNALAIRLGLLMQHQRTSSGLTQAVLSERAQLSLKYLGEIERGEANVTVDALKRLALALNWDPWALFSLEPPPIAQSVHQLLRAELTSTARRLLALDDWLASLDPRLRPPTGELPPFEGEGEPRKADGTRDRRHGPRPTGGGSVWPRLARHQARKSRKDTTPGESHS